MRYAHSLGEIVSAAVETGRRVVRLEEHHESPVGLAGKGLLRELRGTGHALPNGVALVDVDEAFVLRVADATLREVAERLSGRE